MEVEDSGKARSLAVESLVGLILEKPQRWPVLLLWWLHFPPQADPDD